MKSLPFILLLSITIMASCGDDEEVPKQFVSPDKKIKITFVGDDGVIVTDGTKTVLIDALVTRFDIWKIAAPGLITSIKNGTAPYDKIAANLVTHDHFDHWDIGTTQTFLKSHLQSTLIAPPQVTKFISSNSQVTTLAPPLFQAAETTVDGIKIKALRMVHFNNFGLDFSPLENLAFLVELGGMKILHLGDADFTEKNFAPFQLQNENIDVVIIPAATIKLTAQNLDLVKLHINPKNIIAAHLEGNVSEAQVKSVWGNITVFTESLQFVEY
jgi:L-ascorbate metabolism protein UlaG (beta-lactamase superfamily)